jgi:hypothetical protein
MKISVNPENGNVEVFSKKGDKIISTYKSPIFVQNEENGNWYLILSPYFTGAVPDEWLCKPIRLLPPEDLE